MSKAELEKNYLESTYSVFIEKDKVDIKIGKMLPLIIQSLINKEHSAVILTAWNPRSQTLSLSENESRNLALLEKFDKYTVFKAMGQGEDSSWLAEESYFILGLNKNKAELLAMQYEQYAYVWLERGQSASLAFTRIWHDSNR